MANSYLQSAKRSELSRECQYSLKAGYFSPAENEDVDDIPKQAETRNYDHEDAHSVRELNK